VGKGIAWAAMCEQVPVVPGGTRVRTLAYLKLACAKQQWGMVHAGCVPGLSPSLPVSGGTHSGIVGSSSASLRRFFCLLSTDGLCTRFKSAHSGQPHFQIVSPLPGNSLFERGEGGEEGGRGGGEEGGRGGEEGGRRGGGMMCEGRSRNVAHTPPAAWNPLRPPSAPPSVASNSSPTTSRPPCRPRKPAPGQDTVTTEGAHRPLALRRPLCKPRRHIMLVFSWRRRCCC